MQEIWVQYLGWEDPLEEGVATHSSSLAWRIPMDRGPWWLQSVGLQRVGLDWVTKHSTDTESSLKYVVYLAPHLSNCHVGNL